jgi:exodeoxyribonuclease VIII
MATEAPQAVELPKPGVYEDVPMATYRLWPGISASGELRPLAKSPAHCEFARQHPLVPTPAMNLGRATHACVFEPARFARDYMVTPKVDRRTKDGKARWLAFQAEAAEQGREILGDEDNQYAHAVAGAVRAHPAAKALLANGRAELSVTWQDAVVGLACKARPDWDAGGPLVDLKTTRDASPAGFPREIVRYGYHIQAVHYLTGMAAATGFEPDRFVFIAVEKSPPYAVGVYQLSEAAFEAGWARWRELIELYAECHDKGQWPGYGDEIQEIDLPRWAMPQRDENGVGINGDFVPVAGEDMACEL